MDGGRSEDHYPQSVENTFNMTCGSDHVVIRDGPGKCLADNVDADALLTVAQHYGSDLWMDLPCEETNTDYGGIYATVTRIGNDPNDMIAIDYWIHYAYNDWTNDHEGDWEGAVVYLERTGAELLAPVSVAYAQHVDLCRWDPICDEWEPCDADGGQSATWEDLLNAGHIKSREEGQLLTHPELYVGRGSHASYFSALHEILGVGVDHHCGDGIKWDSYNVVVLPRAPEVENEDWTEFKWLVFPGHWGENNRWPWLDGPLGPAFKGRWFDPIGWAQHLDGWPGCSGGLLCE